MTGDETVEKVNDCERPNAPMAGDDGDRKDCGPTIVVQPAEGPVGSEMGTLSDDGSLKVIDSIGPPATDIPPAQTVEAPAVVLPPIYDYDSDVVIPPPELALPKRTDVIEQLIQKHRSMVETFSKEKEDLGVVGQLPEEESDEEKARRDEVNRAVQTLKAERGSLRERNKTISKELFELLDKQERLKDRSKEISGLQRYVSDLEWKIETEDIKIEQERKHLDEIKATMRKLREITDGFTPDEIIQRTTDIQEEIDQNLLRMEEAHRAMLERVEESNLHHGKYIDAQKKARELEAKKQWLTRRVELHTEMGKFWEGQLDNTRKLDSEEMTRPVGSLRDHLLSRMGERPTEKGQEGDQKASEKQTPGPTDTTVSGQREEHGPKGRGPRGRPRKKVGPAESEAVGPGTPDVTAPTQPSAPPEDVATKDNVVDMVPAGQEAPPAEGQNGGGA